MAAEGAGIRFGQYVLLRRLARGGMAEVFLAQQHGLEGFDRRVAVKRILPHLADAPDFIKMFLSEAKLAAQLTHPNIVHIYDFGKVDTDYFIAMEFVDGAHAGELFKHGETHPDDRLSPTMVARLGADAAAALHYAHELRAASGKPYGLVHRDVSPANLMVTFDGAVKLCDFGIAKAAALGEQLTLPGHVKGKYAYMSPEQTTGTPLDGRSDVFALGVVLWELVSGQTIVPRGDAIEAMRAIRDGKLTPIDRVAPWTPPPLANAITWALQTNRDQRPTAMQLAQELEAFIKSSPELATPLQLGSWLRVRFAREQTGEATAYPAGGTQATSGTFAAPTTSGRGAADPQAAPVSDAATVIAGDHAAFEPTDPPGGLASGLTAALRDRPEDHEPDELDADTGRATDTAGDDGPSDDRDDRDDDAGYDTSDPDQNAETVLRTSAFRDPIPSGPIAAPTLYGPRPKSATRPPTAPTLYDPRAAPVNGPPAPTRAAAAPTLYEPRPKSPTSPPAAHTLYDPRPGPQGPGGTLPGGGIAPVPGSAPHPLNAPNLRGPSASAGAPTLLDSRPAAIMRGSPLTGMPALPGPPPPFGPPPAFGPQPPPIPRRALAIGGLIGLAVLSFIIALAARGKPRPLIGAPPLGMTHPPADAALAVIAPADAAPDAPPAPPPDAPAPTIPIDAAPAPDAGIDAARPLTALEIRTRPDGAKVTIGDDARTTPAEFMLPAGHYVIDAEHDGWMPERRELDLTTSTRVVQDIVFTQRRSHNRAQTGKLSARTTPPCEVFLGTRRLTETPFADLELEPGNYTLLFKHPQHPTVIRNITIIAGKTTRVTLTLP